MEGLEVSFLESATAFSKAADILIVVWRGVGWVWYAMVEVIIGSFGLAKNSNVVACRVAMVFWVAVCSTYGIWNLKMEDGKGKEFGRLRVKAGPLLLSTPNKYLNTRLVEESKDPWDEMQRTLEPDWRGRYLPGSKVRS